MLTMTVARIRVLLVDESRIMLEGLAAVLGRGDEFDVIGQAGDAATAMQMFRALAPDVSVVDLGMSAMDGVGMTEAIRAEDPRARVVVLSTYDTDADVFRGLKAGAASYLLKDVDSTALMDTIRTVHAGRPAIAPDIAAKLAEHVASESLTARQLDVLKCLAPGSSNLEIADTLGISEGTVKAHVKAILQKLAARNRTQAITTALKRGILRVDSAVTLQGADARHMCVPTSVPA
ncbi:MAG: response regulator transcription factor [Gemmatimonas sp.]